MIMVIVIKSCVTFLLELLDLTVLVAMATCTNGTCETSYSEQPVSKIDMPVNCVVELKLSALMNKIDYLCINYIVDALGD